MKLSTIFGAFTPVLMSGLGDNKCFNIKLMRWFELKISK